VNAGRYILIVVANTHWCMVVLLVMNQDDVAKELKFDENE
jgi:hypothetical protein